MSEAKHEKVLHFLVRYSDKLRHVNTFQEHKLIEDKLGYCWWGKFGLGAAERVVATARSQLQKEIPTFVYFVTGAKYCYQGRLLDLAAANAGRVLASPEPLATPKYYRHEKCAFWMKLTGLAEFERRNASMLRLYYNAMMRPSLHTTRGMIYVTPARG